ncbi:MAG: hypothetical protein IPH93_16440 [Saprospiraceae bacterium]|nr:hypothetical protein [Saprospiraceae bacterium]
MKSVIFTLILFISFQFQITAQEIIQWYGGIYRDLIQFNPPIAIPKEVPNLIRMKYQDGIITAKRDESAKGFLVNNGASAFDKQGNILFFFNGLRIYDKEGKVMEGGDSLGTKFSNFLLAEDWSFFDTLYGANFGTMYFSQIINYPGYNDQYLLFYTNKYYYSSKDIPFILCYAHIDMRQNNGMGKVISKEIEITRSPNLNPITIIRWQWQRLVVN